MDIVNPYFRTVDAKPFLDKYGVDLVVSPFAETNVDIPAMTPSMYRMVDDVSSYAVIDIGGDDRGALALGRFSDKIKEENDYEMLLVVNKYRPETRDIEGILQIKREIEYTGRINFTGIVNNSNLGDQTTVETVISSEKYIKELCEITKLPLAFTSVRIDLAEEISNTIKGKILPVSLIKYGDWL